MSSASAAHPAPATLQHAIAPTAPGRLGQPVDAVLASRYLTDLETWVRLRRHELDELDAAVLSSGVASAGGGRPADSGADGAFGQLTSDIALSLMVWKAVSDRMALLRAVWDGGRVGHAERERLATLIWGRLDATLDPALITRGGQPAKDMAAGLAVSLPEACRLSDALAGQLRARLRLDPAADANATRIRELRAQVERTRDQVALEPAVSRPAAAAQLTGLASRVDDLYAKAQRGGDVGGLLGPLEIEVAKLERDLIVGSAKRRDARDLVQRARDLRADLVAREAALAQLADRCVSRVAPAPRLAVPDVDALGPVPNTPDALQTYLVRLDRVGKALGFAQERYSAALDEHAQLAGRLEALAAKAASLGLADHPDLTTAGQLAGQTLARRPAPMPVCHSLLALYQTWLEWAQNQSARPLKHKEPR